MRQGFDNDKYLEMQSEQIRKRINQFGGKLYMEFGESCLMISMRHAYFRDFSRTARSAC